MVFKLRFAHGIIGFLIFLTVSQLYLFLNRSFSRHQGVSMGFLDNSRSTTLYERLLKVETARDLPKRPFRERCNLYFDELYKLDEGWSIGQLKDMSYSFDVQDKLAYYLREYDRVVEQYKKEDKQVDEQLLLTVFDKLQEQLLENEIIEQKLQNSVGHLRVYGSCFIQNEHLVRHSKCLDIEARLFPWMTFESPIFERWDGTVLNEFPDISKFYKYKGMGKKKKKTRATALDSCFMYDFKDELNGRGIVLSVGDQLIEELVNLIKILRFFRNELPIQVVHKGDLAYKSKQILRDLLRNTLVLDSSMAIDFAPQELWFVDANRCFLQEYYHNFDHFANKWIAVIFNSFEDMLLMDTDAVPFIKPADFFELGEYKKNGAFFFKDRTSPQKIPQAFLDLFYKLFPSGAESALFGTSQVSERTYGNRLFAHHTRHSMESGIVVMNRKKKLLGILLAVHIQFWGPLNEYIHGEKEIFWLAQSLAGNEYYEFNANSAGAVGVVQQLSDKYPDHVVGIQPAHVAADNETLLWINSGVKNCKNPSWNYDHEHSARWKGKFGSKEALRDFFNSPIDIRGVVIPPETFKAWPNKQGFPELGWEQRTDWGCDGYMWLLYSKVGGNEVTDAETYGTTVRFSQESVQYYNKIARLWISKVESGIGDYEG